MSAAEWVVVAPRLPLSGNPYDSDGFGGTMRLGRAAFGDRCLAGLTDRAFGGGGSHGWDRIAPAGTVKRASQGVRAEVIHTRLWLSRTARGIRPSCSKWRHCPFQSWGLQSARSRTQSGQDEGEGATAVWFRTRSGRGRWCPGSGRSLGPLNAGSERGPWQRGSCWQGQ